MTNFNHFDLFCGPGGFATGFEWAGFKTVIGVDIHKPSLETFKINHQSAKTFLGDIREVSDKDLTKIAGTSDVHVLSAGVPCEGFSMSNRNRTKFTDERNFLFLEFLRIAEALKPEVLLVENVANLASHDKGFFAQEIESGMANLGYETSSTVLDASHFGIPQRRRRVMFIGFKPGYSFKWPVPTHGKNLIDFVTVGDAILGDLPRLKSGQLLDKYSGPALTEYVKFLRKGSKTLLNHEAPNHPQSTIERIKRTKPGEPMYDSFKQRIRLHPDKISPTIVSGGIRPQFAYGHPTQARGLSIRERARLMSFPDWYEFVGGIVQGRVQTGDAVPPILANKVASEIMSALTRKTDSRLNELGKIHLGQITRKQSVNQLELDISQTA